MYITYICLLHVSHISLEKDKPNLNSNVKCKALEWNGYVLIILGISPRYFLQHDFKIMWLTGMLLQGILGNVLFENILLFNILCLEIRNSYIPYLKILHIFLFFFFKIILDKWLFLILMKYLLKCFPFAFKDISFR